MANGEVGLLLSCCLLLNMAIFSVAFAYYMMSTNVLNFYISAGDPGRL